MASVEKQKDGFQIDIAVEAHENKTSDPSICWWVLRHNALSPAFQPDLPVVDKLVLGYWDVNATCVTVDGAQCCPNQTNSS